MVYANFRYYETKYFGTSVPEEEFGRIVKKASQYIDHFTFGRITEENMGEYPTLPDCACDMCDAIFVSQKNKEKKSENIDGYSVTYVTEGVDGETSERMLEKKLYSIAKLYLLETGLLYCGTD